MGIVATVDATGFQLDWRMVGRAEDGGAALDFEE